MPRPNKARSIGGESNLAERIKYERDAAGWSPAELARKMSEEGCSISTSAIYKIEAGDRTIKVDELVALSQVFGLGVDNLLRPMQMLRQEWAEQRVRDLDEAEAALYEACSRLGDVWTDIYRHGVLDALDGVEEEDSVIAYLNNRRRGDAVDATALPPLARIFSTVAEAIQRTASTIVVEETEAQLGDGVVEAHEEES